MIALDSADVKKLLPMRDCIDLMRTVMRAVSVGETSQILRQILSVPGGVYGIMGGSLPQTFGSKLISAVKPDDLQGRPSHQGMVILFDPTSGAPVALIDATYLTAIRTAAASAMATDILAQGDADSLAILGTGEQAYMHAHAICATRPIRSIVIWRRNAERAEKLVARLATELSARIRATTSVKEATGEAQIICTVTSSTEPILSSREVAPGTHVNAVGSSHLGPREIDDSLVLAAQFFGDSRDSILSQGAEFNHARESGLITDAHFQGEIGEVVAGICQGRHSPEAITLYKSLGHVAQDLAAGWFVYRAAMEAGAGQEINI